jgi:hypothetical protein
VILLNFEEDGLLVFRRSLGVEHETRDAAPAAAAAIGRFEPVELTGGECFDVDQGWISLT